MLRTWKNISMKNNVWKVVKFDHRNTTCDKASEYSTQHLWQFQWGTVAYHYYNVYYAILRYSTKILFTFTLVL